jgi:tyrosinase
MASSTRRRFLKQAAATASFPLLSGSIFANAQTPKIRYNVLSPEGQAMVRKYAQAVRIMKGKPATDPCSWTFWWYTHAIPVPKATAIQQVFGGAQSPARDLAERAWWTCQPHSNGQNTDNFLPWHRMYVYFFEQTIRALLHDDAFTLPYWNYSPGRPSSQSGVMPQAFRSPSIPELAPLYVANRNPGVNTGSPIDANAPGALSATSAMAETTYSPHSPKQGFCNNLDFGLHGNVHDLVGTGTNMGYVPTAAQDPIFWMHHCNIDRLWASWNKNGHPNPNDPGWKSQRFWFAGPDCRAASQLVGDVLSIAPLGYTYQEFQAGPRSLASKALTLGSQTPVATSTVAASTNVALSGATTRVALAGAGEKRLFDLTLNAAATDLGRYYLVVRDLQVKSQPGVLYEIYLDLPQGASAETREAHKVGSLSFFTAMPGMRMDEPTRFVSYDISALVKKLGDAAVSGPINLTVSASGQPAEGSQPVIGSISIVKV